MREGQDTRLGTVAVVEKRIASRADDAEEAAGLTNIASSDLELTDDGAQTGRTVGLRFTDLAIPQGAIITAAWIQFQVDEPDSGPASLRIRAHDADNASPFTTARNDISERPVTSAVAVWQPEAWTTVGAAGPTQRTPNLRAVVQKIVNRPGWTPGNAMAFLITGVGERTAESFDGDAAAAPLLHIGYESSRTQAFDMVEQMAVRLREVAVYRDVFSALDAAGLGAWPKKCPSAFVIPLAETAGDSVAPAFGAVQRVTTTVGVHTLIAAPNDPGGEKSRSELAATLEVSRRALAGWRPHGAAEVLTYRRGLLLGLEQGRLEWRDEYALVWWIEATQGTGARRDSVPGDPGMPARMRT